MMVEAIFIGIVATGFMDLIAAAQWRLFQVPSLNYAMVGRWLSHIPKGRLIHRAIGQSPPVGGEAELGWIAHYLTGILFAAGFLHFADMGSVQMPGPVGPVLFGAATVVAPFLLLQPALGAGIAARRTPSPWIARTRSLFAHTMFGLGLWIGGLLLAWGAAL